jgi:hypothetical protein
MKKKLSPHLAHSQNQEKNQLAAQIVIKNTLA